MEKLQVNTMKRVTEKRKKRLLMFRCSALAYSYSFSSGISFPFFLCCC